MLYTFVVVRKKNNETLYSTKCLHLLICYFFVNIPFSFCFSWCFLTCMPIAVYKCVCVLYSFYFHSSDEKVTVFIEMNIFLRFFLNGSSATIRTISPKRKISECKTRLHNTKIYSFKCFFFLILRFFIPFTKLKRKKGKKVFIYVSLRYPTFDRKSIAFQCLN